MNARTANARGFTLIELVVVITIAAIVAVFVVFFLATPVEAYFAQSSRASLVDSSDRILRSLVADVPTALPNSLRETGGGGVVALELLATTATARYYGSGDKNYLPPAQEALEELSIGQPDADFYTLDLFGAASGSYLAILNPGAPGAYAFGGVMTPLPPQFTITPVGATLEDHVHFAGAGFNFTNASPTNSVFLVSGPVSYLCDTNAQTVQRYTGYSVSAAQPATDAQLMAAGATRSLIAQNVASCTITIVPAPASALYNQLAIVEATLASNGETLQLFDEIAVESVP
jgi:MSHA biogenesis protein MshO